MELLSAFADGLPKFGLNGKALGVGGPGMAEELRLLPDVLDLLNRRRQRLWGELHPTGDGTAFSPTLAQFGADRADGTLVY